MSIPNILPNPLTGYMSSVSLEQIQKASSVSPEEAAAIATALAASIKMPRYNPGAVGTPSPVSDQMRQDVALLQGALPENCGKLPSPRKEKWYERFVGRYPTCEYCDPTVRDLQSLLPKPPSRHPNEKIRKLEDQYNRTVASVEVNTRKFVRKLNAGIRAGVRAAKNA